ncbi:glycosyl transferase [Flavobacterium cyanobacteriorum]|uniref:Glycosyl transferase n=1 Tax=Flavobacterium cyanobacteriorum TaxID=2022802 RepID=A0A255Z2I2_9FLAO|nr:transglycosylase domain-containing protein [Flavobacterium cyanobacteriorum]OYQ35124.1 glycosyl transferase [Flavobacterium cyanobacteriorum]
MRKINKKKLAVNLLKVVAVVIILGILSFFAFRNMVLDKAISKISKKMETGYNSTFLVKAAKFEGLSHITMEGITIRPRGAATLLQVERIKTSVNLLKLFTGNIQLGTLEMKNGYVQLVKDSTGSNYERFLKRGKKTEEDDNNKEANYAERAYSILTKALNLVPTDMSLENLTLKMDYMGKKVSLNMDHMRLADKQLESEIVVTSNNLKQTWMVKGFADPRNKKANLKFFNTDTSRIQLPYLDERYGLKAAFDSIQLNVTNLDMSGGEMRLDGFASITNFMVNHPKIAKKDVIIDKARFDYRFLFGEDFIALDSTSTAQLNKIKVKPLLKYSVEKDTVYQLKADIPKMKAQDFITSLPKGLFSNFEGMEAEGTFSYGLNFIYNKNKPREIVFDSNLKKEGLAIIKYGAADLNRLNGAFTYRAIENGVQQRPVFVGFSNPFYTPLNEISPYLRKALLTSEDPSFFRHRGFITEAFRQSIIKNIKTRKFARGASTISMQLVKNVFLTREKTLSRKLEEILLVYILENNRIVSKERMLEVYFNIIEWGPNVYGVGEAARYYFQKHPGELSLDESIYLASIVPRPKAFMWKFDSQGNLKSYAERHNDYIKKLMLRRGLLIPEDTIAQNGLINITGPARSRLNIKAEEVPVENDSVDFDEFDF